MCVEDVHLDFFTRGVYTWAVWAAMHMGRWLLTVSRIPMNRAAEVRCHPQASRSCTHLARTPSSSPARRWTCSIGGGDAAGRVPEDPSHILSNTLSGRKITKWHNAKEKNVLASKGSAERIWQSVRNYG